MNVLIAERGGAVACGQFRPAMQAHPRAVTKTMKGYVKMKLNTVLTIALAMFIVVGTANAADRYFRGTTNQNWSNANNWSATSCSSGNNDGVPGDSDNAIICDGVTCNLDTDDKVGVLEIQGAGVLNTGTYNLELSLAGGLQLSDALAELNVGAGGLILCSEDSTTTKHNIDGDVYLTSSTSVLQFSTDDAEITGDGAIVGQDDSAQIDIATATKTLTSNVAIEGKLQIGGSGIFTNQGTVDANASGTLLVSVATANSSDQDGRWRSSNGDAQLELSAGSYSSMAGGFTITAGEIVVTDVALTTTGRLQMTGGLLDVQKDLTMGDATHHASISGGGVQVADGEAFLHN
jgi:hypothetical protein